MLTSLPGISTRSLDALANEDQINFIGVIEGISDRVAMRIESDFATNIGMELKAYNDVFCTGRITDPLTFVPASVVPGKQGMVFEFLQSKHLVMRIMNLYFRADVAKTMTFEVIDLFTGDILDTITQDLQPGENKISINREYYPRRHSNKLFIGYDGTTTGYFSSKDSECYDGCVCDCEEIKSCGGCSIISGYRNIYTDQTYGLSVEWALNCSFCRLLLDSIHLFKPAILYAAGMEYLFEVMGSSRVNRFTSVNSEQNAELMESFRKMYYSTLRSATKNLNLCDSCCFDCVGGIQYGYVNKI
jgi:hypothetical protein